MGTRALSDSQRFSTIANKTPFRGVLRVGRLKVSCTDRYTNFIHINWDERYVGYIARGLHRFVPRPEAKALPIEERWDLWNALTELNNAWSTTIVKEGNMTGVCACCRKELTNPASVALGIGPDCAKRWKVKI